MRTASDWARLKWAASQIEVLGAAVPCGGGEGIVIGDLGSLAGCGVEAGHLETFTPEQRGQGQADATRADDPDAGFAGFNLLHQLV
jgi:hypothetical protein